jgi:hypothetical protein
MRSERIEITGSDITLRVAGGEIFLQVGAEITTIDSTFVLRRALDQADDIALRQTQEASEYAGRCQVHLIHEDKTESQCVRLRAHLLDDTDHVDQHGHHAPVLVHQSTILEVKRIQDARDAGLIE